MAVFFGEMQHRDHPTTMPATIHVDKADVRIQSGRTVLGEWKLYEVQIEEQDPESIIFRADQEELILKLKEHRSFLAETANYRTDTDRHRRLRTHEAFRKDEEAGPSLTEEIKGDVSREVSGVADEIRDLWEMVPWGRPLWIGLAVLLVLIVFLPGLVVGLLFAIGVISLLVGAISYVETSVALKLPEALSPVRLIAIGTVAIGAGILVSIIR
jgi:hypothetical protein